MVVKDEVLLKRPQEMDNTDTVSHRSSPEEMKRIETIESNDYDYAQQARAANILSLFLVSHHKTLAAGEEIVLEKLFETPNLAAHPVDDVNVIQNRMKADKFDDLRTTTHLVRTIGTRSSSPSLAGVSESYDSAYSATDSESTDSEDGGELVKISDDVSSHRRWPILAIGLMLAVIIYYGKVLSPQYLGKDTVYVAGGGFSSFWFTFGRLQSISDPSTKDYYCFSAGCLAVAATLGNLTKDALLEMASKSQQRWKVGEISRYDVVGEFVDDLIYRNSNQNISANNAPPLVLNSFLLSKMHIITTAKRGWFGLKAITRSPSNLAELRTLLLQTAWIPFATGDGLWLLDHMDGAFSFYDHPSCESNLGIVFELDLLLNALNVNLGKEQAVHFWERGLFYGL